MAFPLATVLSAAPGLISAAADIIRVIRDRKKKMPEPQPGPVADKINELISLIEKQAIVIEELAVNNRNLALAVRNNRIMTGVSLVIGVSAVILSIV